MKTAALFVNLILVSIIIHAQENVLEYTELQNYLPKTISGYESGDPGGQTSNMQGLTFSSANIEFTNPDGDYIRITLLDYAGADNMYQAATATWKAGMSYENEEVSLKQVTWNEYVAGWEQYHKTDRESVIALGISERFFLTIEANNQDNTNLVVSIAQKMDLEGLASK